MLQATHMFISLSYRFDIYQLTNFELYYQTLEVKSHHALVMQCIGAFMVALTFQAWYAPSYGSNEDRKMFFLSQILVSSQIL